MEKIYITAEAVREFSVSSEEVAFFLRQKKNKIELFEALPIYITYGKTLFISNFIEELVDQNKITRQHFTRIMKFYLEHEVGWHEMLRFMNHFFTQQDFDKVFKLYLTHNYGVEFLCAEVKHLVQKNHFEEVFEMNMKCSSVEDNMQFCIDFKQHFTQPHHVHQVFQMMISQANCTPRYVKEFVEAFPDFFAQHFTQKNFDNTFTSYMKKGWQNKVLWLLDSFPHFLQRSHFETVLQWLFGFEIYYRLDNFVYKFKQHFTQKNFDDTLYRYVERGWNFQNLVETMPDFYKVNYKNFMTKTLKNA